MRIELIRPMTVIRLIYGMGWLIWLIAGSTALAQSQQPMIEVAARVDRSVITIGDRITYSLIINRDKHLRIIQPGPGANLGMFEIKDYQIHDPVEKEGRIIEQFDYVISVFDTGKFVIPPFPVAFFPDDTTRKPQIIQSEPLEITVKSVLTSADAELKDIKPPLTIPYDYARLALIAGAALGLLLLVGGIIWYVRKRRRGEPLFRREVIRPAHEIALERLDALLQSSYLSNGEVKAFFTELSEIVRQYLENRFFIPALEETTSELLASLQEMDVKSDALELLEKALRLSDLVKFAKYIPDREEINTAILQVRQFIEATRLEFQPVEVVERVEPENENQVYEADENADKSV